MSKSSVYLSEAVVMNELNNLFIEMTAKNCNQRCKNCYINFPQYKRVEDFISIDLVKKALVDTAGENINCIYLVGAEPMTHPDFNAILRLCLKRCNVCIFTNGSFINEKKARFLKKVQDESSNEIIFKISFAHYEEVKNDDVRSRGSYRQAVFALKQLLKYNFSPIAAVANFYDEDKNSLYKNFSQVFANAGIDTDGVCIDIFPYNSAKSAADMPLNVKKIKTDCASGRVLTSKGVYSCPFLSDDYRGRCGSSFENYSKKCALETDFCSTCIKAEKPIFGINWED